MDKVLPFMVELLNLDEGLGPELGLAVGLGTAVGDRVGRCPTTQFFKHVSMQWRSTDGG